MAKVRVYQMLPHNNTTLKEYIDLLQDRLESVPDEVKDSVTIYFDTECSYGDYYVNIETVYWREETEEEKIIRQDKERRAAEVQKLQELKLLADLKAKYPDNLG